MIAKKIVVFLSLQLAVVSGACAQGSLIPPGAPAATMKTLEQVEPRIPISSLPYTITSGGSYYVRDNLSSTGHGIVIATNDVTVDLMGFSIGGDGDGCGRDRHHPLLPGNGQAAVELVSMEYKINSHGFHIKTRRSVV